MAEHHYNLTTTWTGNTGSGTSGYRDYERSVTIEVAGKVPILASADKPFRGDGSKHNPEELLIAAIAECHLLSYLHACVLRGVVVTSYRDTAVGTLIQEGNGGHFSEVILHPVITVSEEKMIDDAIAAHHEAHEWCFIASSVNFEIRIDPAVSVGV